MARLCLHTSINPSTAVPYVFPDLISTCLSITDSVLRFTLHAFLRTRSKPALVKRPTFLTTRWASSKITYQIQLWKRLGYRNASIPKRHRCELCTGLLNPVDTETDLNMHRCSSTSLGNFKAVTVMHLKWGKSWSTQFWIWKPAIAWSAEVALCTEL